jgi:polyphosphate glucokinase
MSRADALGIDIGGSGIKGALVDVDAAELATDRIRIKTPRPSTPEAVAETVSTIVGRFDWDGPIACAIPAIVRRGIVRSAANIDKSWIGIDAPALFLDALGRDVAVLNDADAAGIAEVRRGAGRGVSGVVCLLTFGTGIGSAVFLDGRLLPNTEFGHLRFKKGEAEDYAASSVREEKGLSWKEWGRRVNEYLNHVELLISPDLFIVGGGISRRFDEFSGYLDTEARIAPAAFRNHAGIIGAAMVAAGSSEDA